MVQIQVYDRQGQGGGTVEVDETVLGEEVNLPVLRQVVRMYEANQRVGTRHTKSRGEVAASTRKLYRQKHTGNARAGSRAACQRRGGGMAHALSLHDWSQRMPRKMRRLATRSALLARLKDNEISLLESLSLESPQTRTIAKLLKDMGIERSCLLVLDGGTEEWRNVWKSARNIPGVEVRRVGDVNAHDLLASDRVVFTRSAFDALMKACAP